MLLETLGIDPRILWILAIAAAMRWLVTGGSMAYERIVSSRPRLEKY